VPILRCGEFIGLLSFPCAAYGGVPAFVCGKAAKRNLMFLISDDGATGNDARNISTLFFVFTALVAVQSKE
jgi:hypothetical protein